MNHVSITKVINNETVAATASVNSKALLTENGEDFSVILIVSGTAVDVKVEYQVIASTQGDQDLVGSNAVGEGELGWITPNTGSTIIASVTSDASDGFAPVVTKWMRIKVTGNAGNHLTDTKVTAYLIQNDRI